MRFLRKTIILALAGLGAYRAWELLGPKLNTARDQAAQARDRIEPALRDAKRSVEDASRDAASTVAGASKQAAGSLADATSGAVESAREPSNASSGSSTGMGGGAFGNVTP
ncbi:MAG: hypothetical protein JOZ99_13630 [Actinobacteria bacterium]|nr:hypothetical protein [Actinomycetota bacterium]